MDKENLKIKGSTAFSRIDYLDDKPPYMESQFLGDVGKDYVIYDTRLQVEHPLLRKTDLEHLEFSAELI